MPGVVDFFRPAQRLDRGLGAQVGAADTHANHAFQVLEDLGGLLGWQPACFCASKGRLIQPRKSDPRPDLIEE